MSDQQKKKKGAVTNLTVRHVFVSSVSEIGFQQQLQSPVDQQGRPDILSEQYFIPDDSSSHKSKSEKQYVPVFADEDNESQEQQISPEESRIQSRPYKQKQKGGTRKIKNQRNFTLGQASSALDNATSQESGLDSAPSKIDAKVRQKKSLPSAYLGNLNHLKSFVAQHDVGAASLASVQSLIKQVSGHRSSSQRKLRTRLKKRRQSSPSKLVETEPVMSTQEDQMAKKEKGGQNNDPLKAKKSLNLLGSTKPAEMMNLFNTVKPQNLQNFIDFEVEKEPKTVASDAKVPPSRLNAKVNSDLVDSIIPECQMEESKFPPMKKDFSDGERTQDFFLLNNGRDDRYLSEEEKEPRINFTALDETDVNGTAAVDESGMIQIGDENEHLTSYRQDAKRDELPFAADAVRDGISVKEQKLSGDQNQDAASTSSLSLISKAGNSHSSFQAVAAQKLQLHNSPKRVATQRAQKSTPNIRGGMTPMSKPRRVSESSDDDTGYAGEIRHQPALFEALKVWHPISRVEKHYTMLDKETKTQKMQAKLEKLADENAEYFRGKEVRYDNRAGYIQCMVDSMRPGGYIAVQRRQKIVEKEETQLQQSQLDQTIESQMVKQSSTIPKIATHKILEIQPLTSENQVFSASDMSLTHYARLCLSDEAYEVHEDQTIISLWRQNEQVAKAQYECWATLKVRGMVMKPLMDDDDDSKKGSQCLYTGINQQVFFFTFAQAMLRLNIFDPVAQTGLSSRFTESIETKGFPIRLESQLGEQLQTQQIGFSFPEPTLVTLGGSDYLVLTEVDQNQIPQICFYKLNRMEETIAEAPTLVMERAEQLINCTSRGELSFLTNVSLLSHSSQPNGIGYARMVSPSMVVNISITQLMQFQKITSDQTSEEILNNCQKLYLKTDPDSMIYFRTETHQFPYVGATPSSDQKGLVLRFYGCSDRPQIAIYFSYETEQTSYPAIVDGNFINREGDTVRVELSLRFTDASGSALSEASSGKLVTRAKFGVRQVINGVTWTRAISSSLSSRLPFTLSNLKFSPQTGQLIGGKADVKIGSKTVRCELIADHKHLQTTVQGQEDAFNQEKRFKVLLVPTSEKGDTSKLVATMEGCVLNEPVNTMLLGQYKALKDGVYQLPLNFAIQKQVQAKMSFDMGSAKYDFNVEIKGGVVQDISRKISLYTSPLPSLLMKYAHQVIQDPEEGALFIMHGDLKRLQDRPSKSSGKSGQQYKSVLSLAKIVRAIGSQIDRYDMSMESESRLREKLHKKTTNDTLIQGVSISADPLQVNYVYLLPDAHGYDNNRMEFIQDQPSSGGNDADDSKQSYVGSGLVSHQHMIYYPLLAYNSYMPDNSELVITSLVERKKHSHVVRLGMWRFVCFVESPYQGNLPIKKLHSQIFFLASHSESNKLRLLMLDQDPWTKEKQSNLYIVQSGDIPTLPFPLDDLKNVQLLTAQDEMCLILQFRTQLWQLPLRYPENMAIILDPNDDRWMKQKPIVRRSNDSGQAYALALRGQRSEVIRIRLNLEYASDKLHVETIYESANSNLIVLETDQESLTDLFIIDEQQRIIRIEDVGETKATLLGVSDMQEHDLDDELEQLEKSQFTSVTISSRRLAIDDFSFSLRSKMFWQEKAADQRELISERNLTGTLCSLQNWLLADGTTLLSCKPLVASCYVDLMGQYRSTAKMMAYMINDERVLVVSPEDKRMLIFDRDGYICHDQKGVEFLDEQLADNLEILKLSAQSKTYGRFILFRSVKEDKKLLSLVQSDSIGFNVIAEQIKEARLATIVMKRFDPDLLIERLNVNKQENPEQRKQNIIHSFQTTFKTHMNHIQVSRTGELIIPASVVISQADLRQTIFQEQDHVAGGGTEEKFSVGKPLFGWFKINQIRIIVFVCQNKEQQEATENKINTMTARKRRKSSKNDTGLAADDKGQAGDGHDVEFISGVVGTKFAWLHISKKQIQYIDYVDLDEAAEQGEDYVSWASVSCPTFSIEELLQAKQTQEARNKGVSIDEISPNSLLHVKQGRKLPPMSDFEKAAQNSCYMQLTIGGSVIVYDLGAQQRQEIGMIENLDLLESPFALSNTGFVCNQSAVTLETNISCSLGVKRPCSVNLGQSVYRPFCEMDLHQLRQISQVVQKKSIFSKGEIGDIEPETLVRIYGQETFFTLFSEQAPIYDAVIDALKAGFSTEMIDRQVEEPYATMLDYVMDRPTPLAVAGDQEEMPHIPCEMSLIKQALLFTSREAAVNVFLVAEQLNRLFLNDLIDCIEDMAMMIDRLPAQQYSLLLNKLERNQQTQAIIEAVMDKRGEKSKLITFIQESAVLWDRTPALGLQREQKDDEVRQEVMVRVLPLQAIQSYDLQVNLFRFIRDNLSRLQGSLLLNAIFQAFWAEQKKQIYRFAFLPFLIFFSVANFYYTQCMLPLAGRNRSFHFVICLYFAEESQCDVQDEIEPVLWGLFLFFTFHQIAIGTYQAISEGFRSYLKLRSNQIDIVTHTLNVTTLILVKTGVSEIKIRILGSIAIICMWVQMFFWFRLFDSLAQYVDLIFQTVNDIRNFMIVLFAIIITFMSGFYMIQLNRIQTETGDVFDEQNGNGALYNSGLVNQYFLLLGEFNRDGLWRSNEGFKDGGTIWLENSLCMLYFIGSTFIMQIVIFNMLIAIMAATFSRHTTDLEQNAKRQKLILQSEYVKLVKFYRCILRFMRSPFAGKEVSQQAEKPQQGYLYVLTPMELENEDGTGQKEPNDVKAMKKELNDRFRELDTFLNKRVMPSIGSLTEEMGGRLETLEQTSSDLSKALKREQQAKFNKMRDDILRENLVIVERTESVETSLHADMLEQKKQVNSLRKDVTDQHKAMIKQMKSLEQACQRHARFDNM